MASMKTRNTVDTVRATIEAKVQSAEGWISHQMSEPAPMQSYSIIPDRSASTVGPTSPAGLLMASSSIPPGSLTQVGVGGGAAVPNNNDGTNSLSTSAFPSYSSTVANANSFPVLNSFASQDSRPVDLRTFDSYIMNTSAGQTPTQQHHNQSSSSFSATPANTMIDRKQLPLTQSSPAIPLQPASSSLMKADDGDLLS